MNEQHSTGAGQQRNVKISVASRAAARRREINEGIRKDRRETLLRAKRQKWEENDSMEDEMKPDDEEGEMKRTEEVGLAVQELHGFVRGPGRGKTSERVNALKNLRHLLCTFPKINPSFKVAVDAGIVPLLIDCLDLTAPEEQLVNATWCLSNIAAGSSEDTMAVLPASALLIAHTGANNPLPVIEQCCWALSNLAAEGTQTVPTLLSQGTLQALSRLLLTVSSSNAAESLMTGKTVAWALSNILRFGPAKVSVDLLATPGIPSALNKLLNLGNAELSAEVAWVLAYVSAKADPSSAAQLLSTGVASSLLLLADANQTSPALLTPVVRTFGNLTAMDDTKTDLILSAGSTIPAGGTLAVLGNCIKSDHRAVQKEASWAISNITGGSVDHKNAVLNSVVFQQLIALFKMGAFDLKKESGFALANLCVGPSRTQFPLSTYDATPVMLRLVEEGCLSRFLKLVRSPDVEASRLGLQFVEMVLRTYPGKRGPKIVEGLDGIETLESLQFHENDELRTMANSLVDQYFGEEYGLEDDVVEEEEEDVAFPDWRAAGHGRGR